MTSNFLLKSYIFILYYEILFLFKTFYFQWAFPSTALAGERGTLTFYYQMWGYKLGFPSRPPLSSQREGPYYCRVGVGIFTPNMVTVYDTAVIMASLLMGNGENPNFPLVFSYPTSERKTGPTANGSKIPGSPYAPLIQSREALHYRLVGMKVLAPYLSSNTISEEY